MPSRSQEAVKNLASSRQQERALTFKTLCILPGSVGQALVCQHDAFKHVVLKVLKTEHYRQLMHHRRVIFVC